MLIDISKIGIVGRGSNPGGIPILAWRFANGTPIRRIQNGYWLKVS